MSRSAAALDLLTRVALFVLAAVAALAIVGAIAAIPGDVARSLARQAERAVSVEREPSSTPTPARSTLRRPVGRIDRVSNALPIATGVTADEPPVAAAERIADWLEVIAYALIANAGLMALFGLALLRRRGN